MADVEGAGACPPREHYFDDAPLSWFVDPSQAVLSRSVAKLQCHPECAINQNAPWLATIHRSASSATIVVTRSGNATSVQPWPSAERWIPFEEATTERESVVASV